MLSSMENYKILEQIGKGVQFTLYKVESKIDGKIYIVKKVECHDESQANLAFREAVALQALDHPYISGYKEFFVTWEKEESSMYMVIVMEYFPKGHLGNVVQNARDKKQPIPEETIKKYIGQLMEALVYSHNKNILHRDLRVSNVYLVEEPLLQEDILILGDFTVASVMCDTRTCTRRTNKLTNYLAPELTEKAADFSEATDVWSLGCVLFDLTTASFLTEEEAVARLGEVREDPYKLEEVFEDVAKNYSGDLINLIRALLKRNNRPTAKDLVEKNLYVKSCIEKSDASQLEKRKRQKSGKRVKGPVPKEGNVLKVMEYIATMVDFEECVAEALEYLVELSKQDDNFNLDINGKRMIKAAMRNNLPIKEIQIAGCNLFNCLIISANKDDVIFTSEIISVIPLAMEEHEDCVELQQVACTLLMAIAAQDSAASIAGLYGAIERVLSALEKHISNPELCSTACHALWSLAVNENNVKIASDVDAMDKVCKALKMHMNSAEVAEAASAALLSLTLNAMLWIVSKEPPSPTLDVPTVEDLLLGEGYTGATDKIKWLKTNLAISKEKIEQVAQMTAGQRNNHLWALVRKNRLTASNFGKVLAAIRRNRFPPSLFKQILASYDLSTKDAIVWGVSNESVAKAKYCSYGDAVVEDTDKNFDFIGDLECVALLISAIDTHCKNAKVVKNACLALASLVEPDEESAYRVLTDEAPDGGHIAGIPKIIKAYELHKDNAEVVASIVSLVMELAEYDEICVDLEGYKVKSTLREVQQKFVRNEDIMGPCEKALAKLQQSSSPPKISA